MESLFFFFGVHLAMYFPSVWTLSHRTCRQTRNEKPSWEAWAKAEGNCTTTKDEFPSKQWNDDNDVESFPYETFSHQPNIPNIAQRNQFSKYSGRCRRAALCSKCFEANVLHIYGEIQTAKLNMMDGIDLWHGKQQWRMRCRYIEFVMRMWCWCTRCILWYKLTCCF